MQAILFVTAILLNVMYTICVVRYSQLERVQFSCKMQGFNHFSVNHSYFKNIKINNRNGSENEHYVWSRKSLYVCVYKYFIKIKNRIRLTKEIFCFFQSKKKWRQMVLASPTRTKGTEDRRNYKRNGKYNKNIERWK